MPRPSRVRPASLLGAAVLCMAAATARAEPELVVDAGSGAVLHAADVDTPWFPASLTKLMTLFIAFEAIEAGTLALAEPLTVSAAAAAQPEVKLGLRRGATITVEEAITAAAVASANDAAVVLAERLAGSEAQFAARMSARAHALGMSGTRYVNATGLPGDGQRTTARDMATLALRLLADFPQHYHYFGLTAARFGDKRYSTVNGVVGAITGADGIKTGFTCDAGYNIVASAARDGRRLVAVVLGEASSGARNSRAVALLQRALAAPVPAGAPLLAALTSPPAASPLRPRPRLDRESCARGGVGVAIGPGNLPGHGLLIGVFKTRAEGKRAVDETLADLRGVIKGARAVYLERKFERGSSFKVLLVGLERAEAGRACLALRAMARSCHPASHEMINQPQYAWF